MINATANDRNHLSRFVVLQQAPLQPPAADTTQQSTFQCPRAKVTTAAELAAGGEPRTFGVVDHALADVADPAQAVFTACTVSRHFGVALGVLSHHAGLLVNGLPALRFTVLNPKSSLVVPGIDAVFYVAEKIKPYLGPPPQELLGKACPICTVTFEPTTRVGLCRCGQYYHYENAESHAHIPEGDRLDCFPRTRVCRVCGAALTTAEQVTWSPDEL